MSSRQSSGGGLRCSSVSRLPAIDLIGPSELPSSWPMTRISRCHAWRSCSRSGRLTSDSTSRSCGSPPSRNVVRRTSQRPDAAAGQARCRRRAAHRRTSRVSVELLGGAAEHLLHARAHQPLAGAVDDAQPLLRIEGEHRDVDLLHHRAQQRRGLDGAEALLVQRLGERVDLDQRGAERIVRIRRCGRGSRSRPRAARPAGWRASAAARTTRVRTDAARPNRQPRMMTVSVHWTFGV